MKKEFNFTKKDFFYQKPLTQSDLNFRKQIGAGSFGKVYKVNIKGGEDIFALKVLSKNQLRKLDLLDQLIKEIEILSKCNHPNIISLYRVFENDGYIFMLMEFADQGNLYEKIQKNEKIEEKVATDYIKDVIKAIQYLHSQSPSIVHRDIKPENVLISQKGLKIADFGWSNYQRSIRNTYCGTPDYLTPEMILGTGHDESIDVWSLGVLYYEMTHGKTPFRLDINPKD